MYCSGFAWHLLALSSCTPDGIRDAGPDGAECDGPIEPIVADSAASRVWQALGASLGSGSPMLKRSEWLGRARDLDWTFSYVREEEVFPPDVAGRPALAREAWAGWDEPYKTSFTEYVTGQSAKD